jgi:hypothetical protein
MALRKPLVIISGLSSQLPPGDTIEGVSVSSVATAGSGLIGGGSVNSNFRFDIQLAPNPSGLIFVSPSGLGIDGTAQASGNAALVNASTALVNASTALASGNAALVNASTALVNASTALASGNAAIKRTLDIGLNNLSGVSIGDYSSIASGSLLTFSGNQFIAQPAAAGGGGTVSFDEIFALT